MVGMPIVLVNAEYTSRFSAKDHSPGFRAEEVQKDDSRRSFWQRKAKEEPSGWQNEFLCWLNKVQMENHYSFPRKAASFLCRSEKALRFTTPT